MLLNGSLSESSVSNGFRRKGGSMSELYDIACGTFDHCYILI